MMGIRRSHIVLVMTLLALMDCQSVQTPDDGKRWGIAELIETNEQGHAASPQIAMDAAGNAVAVWEDPNCTTGPTPCGTSIWSNRYLASTREWGIPELVETEPTGSARGSQVAVDGQGNAVVVWRMPLGGDLLKIWSNRRTPSDGWGTAERIDDGTGDAIEPQVAVDPEGNAVAVWQQSDGTRDDIWSNRYTPTDGWGAAELIETDAGDARWPQVAMDSNGNAVAVWQQSDGTRDNIWARPYTPGNGWGTRGPIETKDAGSATRPQVAMNPNGNAVAVWQQSDGTTDSIWSNRYTATSNNWGNAELIEDNAGDALAPQVAMDAQGNAVAVWAQSDGTFFDIWSNRYTPSGDWGIAKHIERNDQGSATSPQVAMDAQGNAVAVWIQPDGAQDSTWSNRYTPSFGWGVAERIAVDDVGRARMPQVAVDPVGTAVAVWWQESGSPARIWANRLALPTDVLNP